MRVEFKIYFKSILNPTQDRPSCIWGGLKIKCESILKASSGGKMVERQRILPEVLRKQVFYRIAPETVGNWWNSHVGSGSDVSGFYVSFVPFPAGKYRKWSEVDGVIL
jgi:hypothetical protein